MQYVSNEYKEAMKADVRKRAYVKISLGLINQEAQATAKVISGPFTYYSNSLYPLGQDEKVEKVYATLEENFSRVDGKMYFLPRAGKRTLFNQGLVSEAICTSANKPEILFRFNTADPLDIKGITLDFGESYPSEFIIDTDEETHTYSNDAAVFKTEDVFNNTTFIRIQVTEMEKGHDRFRINSILFGIGITIENNKIVNTSHKATISPISDHLPTVDFSVTVENLDHYYNVDNDDSAINYMETGQEMEFYYGQTIDDESIEWVKGGKLSMKEWSSNDKEAKFTAVDKFEYMQDEYNRGQYYPNGVTLYELAEDVFKDAGIEDYWIDPYLKKINVNNPLPAVKHKECLQLIANAGRSVLLQNRDGLIMIKSSFEPDKEVVANQVAAYGSINNLLEGTDYNEYASFEGDYSRVNGQQYFIPRGENYIDVGYVSASISDSDGYFDENPIITVNMESAYTFYNLTLLFGTIQPTEFIITTFNNGEKRSSFSSKAISEKTVVYYDFVDTDRIDIEFIRAKPNDRIHLKRIIFGEATDYEITYDDLYKAPEGTKLEKIKELIVVRTIYSKGTEYKDLTSEEITLTAGVQAEYEFSFSNAVHNLSASTIIDDTVVNYGIEIIESSTYWCKVKINNPPSKDTKVNLMIRGYEYNLSLANENIQLNNAGTILTWNNPLISSIEDAKNLAEWIGDYYKSNNKYELSYRGDSILDPNDLIFLQSEYVNDLMVRIEETSLDFEGGLKGTLVGRRKV